MWTGLSRKISLVAAARSIIFVMRKLCLSRQIFAVTKVLSRQKYFVTTNIILSQQKFCHDKHTFVATKDMWQLLPVIEKCHCYQINENSESDICVLQHRLLIKQSMMPFFCQNLPVRAHLVSYLITWLYSTPGEKVCLQKN